jgi:hypothetical protein
MMSGRLFKLLFSFFLSITIVTSGYTQRLDSLLNRLDSAYPQEKVYLHFDRSYYNPGEKIWFKAYLTSANMPSLISKIMYAELVDSKGKILQRRVMPVVLGGASSNFELPDTMSNPLVYVRAYTAWMLNFDSSFFYTKSIRILSAIHPTKKPSIPLSYSLHFFPEGGDLVTGVTSRVAFKANDQDGTPIVINGNVTDNKGNKITAFSAVHDGMGYFLFTPLPDVQYKAVWKDKKGLAHETALPDAKKEGVVLSINNSNNNVTFSLTRPDSVGENFTSYYIVAQMQQQLIYSATVNMARRTTITAPIPTDSLADGIVQVTVFNAAQIPVAERILFINHGNYYFITDLHAIEKDITKRGHNTLQVDVGGSLLSNLSISVTDENLNPAASDQQENIFSQLLLTSDLKGYVYNPAYYFSSDEDSVKQQLDLVMMTNGWRRFKWENLLADKWPQINHLPEQSLFLQGKVYGLSPNSLTGKELTTILKNKTGGSEIITIPVNKDGTFKTDGISFFDTARLYYQFNNDLDKRFTSIASFSFDNTYAKPPVQLLPFSMYPAIEPDSIAARKNKVIANLLKQDLIKENKIKSLAEVTVIARKKTVHEKMDAEYTSGFFSGGDGMTFFNDDNEFAKGAPDILTYLQSKVAGLQVSIIGNGSVTWRGSNTSLFVNEISSDVNQIKTLSVNDIAMIKVFRPPFMGDFGSRTTSGQGGAISIYTKNGSDLTSSVKGLDYTLINGYSAIKEFYSPDYANDSITKENDYRATLYWNPFLLMDKNNRRITIPFYNSDNCKKIRVVIEGINEAGQLTREEKIFE